MRCTFNRIAGESDKVHIIKAPPSKSIAHRALIGAALSDGVSVIKGLELSEDISATIDCLSALGADISLTIQYDDDENGESGRLYKAEVTGIFTTSDKKGEELFIMGDKKEEYEAPTLDCRECGSTLRFMIPICTLMYSCNMVPGNQSIKLVGSKRLLSRPLDVYDRLFEYTYVTFSHNSEKVEVEGRMNPGEYTVEGNISSQFITGLLFTLPKLDADSRLIIKPPVESRPYIDITIEVLKLFGINIFWEDNNTIHIPGNQHYTPVEMSIEGDWSNGAILYALARLSAGYKHIILLTGLKDESIQGDKVITALLDELDEGKVADISDCPDLGPVLMAYAAAIGGGRLTGTGRLAIKESDRGNAMKDELIKMGAEVVVDANDIYVSTPNGLHAPSDVIDSHNDHRIAMSMAVLCSLYGGTIDGVESIDKSFPSFIDTLRKAGVNIC